MNKKDNTQVGAVDPDADTAFSAEVAAFLGREGPLSKVIESFDVREDQVRLARAVAATFEKGGVLLSEAGTGTGKTLAYLVSAVLSGKKVVISTATKTLQSQILDRDVPLMEEALGRPVAAELLKGRENYLCLRRYTRWSRQSRLKLDQAVEVLSSWVTKTSTGDRGELEHLPEDFSVWSRISATSETCLGQRCERHEDCFLMARRKAAQRAQIVVVNHHLFFADLAVKSESAGEVLPRYSVAIFDEAQHLESVATQYFGVRVGSPRIAELVRDGAQALGGKKLEEASAARLEAIERASVDFWGALGPDSMRIKGALIGVAADKLTALDQALEAWLKHLAEKDTDEEDSELDSIIRRSRLLMGQLRMFSNPPEPGEVRWIEPRGRGIYLNSVPVDVGPVLSEHLFKLDCPIILTSATLRVGGEFDYIRQRLGVPESARELVAEGPFDYTKQCLIFVPPEMPDANSPQFIDAVINAIGHVVKASAGRAFCLFTSHRILRRAAAALKGKLPYQLLVQGEAPRETLLETFRQDTHSVLFGAQAFWEGVDVPGEALSAVLIDKLPFASPGDPLVEARIEKIKSDGASPFSQYQLPVAAMALRQGVGRLIRRPTDRGVVVILDKRIIEKNYGGFFRKSLPPAPLTRDFNDVLAFFGHTRRS